MDAKILRFESSTGESKTVKDYFRETYKLQLRYDFLPCLQVGTEQRPNYLPMEVCAYGLQIFYKPSTSISPIHIHTYFRSFMHFHHPHVLYTSICISDVLYTFTQHICYNTLPIVLQVCNIVLGQRYQKKLDESQVTNMMSMTCKRPEEREISIRKVLSSAVFNM